MLYIIIALVLALAYLLWNRRSWKHKERRQYENSCVWHNLFNEKVEEIRALEQGRDEETEAYEQMYLSHIEKVFNLERNIEVLREDRQLAFVMAVWHEMHCLPDLDLISAGGIVNKDDWERLKFRMGVLTG